MKSKNFKMYLLGGGIGLSIIIILLLIIGVDSNQVFFDTDSRINERDEVASGNVGSNRHRTIIIHDRTYEGITISSATDVNRFITEDSVNQKGNCPRNIVEIENRIIRNYGIEAVNLCEMDRDFALEIEKVARIIYNDFPTARGYLTNITLGNLSGEFRGTIAYFQIAFPFASTTRREIVGIKTKFVLNTEYFLNIPKMETIIRDASNRGNFPPNATRYSVMYHEFGHYLSFVAMMKSHGLSSPLIWDNNNTATYLRVVNDFVDGTFSLKMIEEAYNNYRRRTNTTMSLFEFRASISKYAVHKNNEGRYIYDETIAEAFADYYVNGRNARAASREIVAVLRKHLGG